MNSLASNGGFPEPPEGDPVRVVSAPHAGEAPPTVPRGFDPSAEEAGGPQASTPTKRLRLPSPSSRVWTWIGIPLAAAAVIAALILLQGEDDPSPTVTVGAPGSPSAPEASPAQGGS